MTLVEERAEYIPLQSACQALGIHRSTVYARRGPARRTGDRARKQVHQPRALTPQQRDHVHRLLVSPQYCDQPPAQVYHDLLDKGEHICSISTMHRILREKRESGERRNQRVPQHHAIPRLEARAPNHVWTWDCSKLATTTRGQYLTLYVVLDLYSRFALAWMVSRKENSALAQQLMSEAVARYRIAAGQLTIHQDRGAPMIAHRYIDLLSEMDITLSHSRPRVSNDNAFSEAQFKTQKSQPDYPDRFQDASHGREWCDDYFAWYNFDHHHSGLAGFTPEQVFTGRYREVAETRQQALDNAYARHPERFVAGPPRVAMPPEKVVINPVTPEELEQGASAEVNFPTLPRVIEARAKSELSLN
jgi:putative transposase